MRIKIKKISSTHFEMSFEGDIQFVIPELTERVSEQSQPDSEEITLAELEKKAIMQALKKYNGRRNKVAKALGIVERTLYRKLIEYGIN